MGFSIPAADHSLVAIGSTGVKGPITQRSRAAEPRAVLAKGMYGCALLSYRFGRLWGAHSVLHTVR
jgi:hypothetical protein